MCTLWCREGSVTMILAASSNREGKSGSGVLVMVLTVSLSESDSNDRYRLSITKN